MTNNRASLFKGGVRRFKSVKLPTGGEVKIRSLSTSEMRAFRASFTDRKGETITERLQRLQELLIAQCVCDDAGARELTDAEALNGAFDDVDGADSACLFHACKHWTGFGVDDDFSAIEDARKNSEATTGN